MRNIRTPGGIGPFIGLPVLAAALLAWPARPAAAEAGWTPLGPGAWHNGDTWDEFGDAMLNPDQERLLVGKPGKGVLINGKLGKCPSLVTKRGDYQDVELHVEFMVARGSNSGVIFHGNYEIQIVDSAHVREPTGAHCGGIYPRAENEPAYHHIDKGSPPRVNAAKPPGQWQTYDLIFQSPRFDADGKKTAPARFVKVVHNGTVIQENRELEYACGPNWNRPQRPRGSVIIQGDYGPVAIRNVRIREWTPGDTGAARGLNVPPEGFAALFNGRDFTGWRLSPRAKEMWSIEDGVLKAPGLLQEWGADLATEKAYRDFVLMLEFRMPTISDSGINFRRLIPEIPGFGDQEQFNLRSRGGMGHLESYYFLPKETAEKHGLRESEKPRVRHIDPEVGAWHRVTITLQGRTITTELDGEVLLDRFTYHDWMISQEPAPIRLQKHIVVRGDNLGAENPCPIEYRNLFIREIEAGPVDRAARRPNVVVLLADDLGWGDLGCYGGPVRTPALDALTAQGVRFTDFHAGAAVCSPSRATLLTGRYHMRAGVYHVLQDTMHNAHLLERAVTLAEVLKRSGYATAHFGKWHLGLTSGERKKPSPAEHGFDYWFGLANGADPSQKDPVNFIRNGKRVGPLTGYACQIVVEDAIRWLDEPRRPDQPFFLNVWFNEPHAVLAAPDEIVSRYGGLNDQAALYSGAIENTDRAVARLVATLKTRGELENTLIVYASDNGSYRDDRNGGLRGAKSSNFEGGLRSPGIFFWPGGIAGGRVEKEPAGAVDVLPTVCGLLGVEKPEGVHLDGADLSPLLTGRGTFQRQQPLFWYLPTSYPAAAIREGPYALVAYRDYELPQDRQAMAAVFDQIAKRVRKENGTPDDAELRTRIFNRQFDDPEARRLSLQYVLLNTFQESWIPRIKAGGFSRFELYDVNADPKQEKDVFGQHPEVAARLRQRLLAIHASVLSDAPDWLPSGRGVASPETPSPPEELVRLLARIDGNGLPEGYAPATHQDYVDRRLAALSDAQRATIGRLWRGKQRIDPDMPNRGTSFVKILECVAEQGK